MGKTFRKVSGCPPRSRTNEPPKLNQNFRLGLKRGPYVVTEFLAGGDLRAMLQQDSSLSIAQITFIMMEILKGISYLHERKSSRWPET